MKRFLAVLLAVVVLFTTVLPKQEAKAEGLTMAMIAGGAYAIASAAGLDFSFTGYDGVGVSQWMQNKVNSWLAGRSIAEAFGTEILRLNVGKLLIPSAAVSGIVSFLGGLKQEYNLTENQSQSVEIQPFTAYGYPVYSGTISGGGQPVNTSFVNSCTIPMGDASTSGLHFRATIDGNYCKFRLYYNDVPISSNATMNLSAYQTMTFAGARLAYSGANKYVNFVIVYPHSNGQPAYTANYALLNESAVIDGSISAIIPGAYSPPEGLNDLQSWEGTVANSPDTNLDDLLDDIFDQGAAGTLDVIGEAVDTPELPEPTPAPTAAPGDIIGGLDVISGQLESIDNSMAGVQEGVGEAVGQLEGINEGVGSISEALEVPTTSEAPTFKFDLTTLFPFCIPFDIYRFVTMFNASPVAPHVQIPFNIPAIGLQYTFDLDFSDFNNVASVLRSVELIAFCVGLAILTSKVIRW